MASGISVKLPLTLDVNDGAYTMNKTVVESVKQNLKNLLLTAPGERIMDPEFGAGLRNLFFEMNDGLTADVVRSKIYEQVSVYLPFITILEINIISAENAGVLSDISPNTMSVKIVYHIQQISASDTLDIKF
jgi:phage baseplate assembly protein W|tara:strand:+ start:486 stop:881 length:396 start_codon:yes stop_codon:yes gene_type:complete